MAVRFRRAGVQTSLDHNELLNKGVRTHGEIDAYLTELDVVRGARPDINSRIVPIENSLVDLDVRLDNTEAAIPPLQQTSQQMALDILEAELRIATTEAEIVTVKNNVAALDMTVLGLSYTITQYNTRIVAVEEQVDGVEMQVATLTTTVNSFDVRLITAENNALAAEQQVGLLTTDVAELGALTNSLGISVASLSGRVSALEANEVAVTIAEVESARVDALGTVFPNLKNRIDFLQHTVNSIPTLDEALTAPRTQTIYSYDAGGNVTRVSVTGDIVRTTDYIYDAQGNVTEEVVTEGTAVRRRTYTYSNGDVVAVNDEGVDVVKYIRTGVDFHLESLPNTRPTPTRVFSVPRYATGTSSLEVYLNGSLVSVQLDYVETNDTTITFNYDVPVASHVIFRSGTGNDYAALRSRIVALEAQVAELQNTVAILLAR